jgi:hypothetical protein
MARAEILLACRYAEKRREISPHQSTWLSWEHTVGSVDRPEPLNSETDFTGLMLLNPATFPEGADTVETQDGRTIHYLALIPLLEQEMRFKKKFDADALEEKLIEADITELLNAKRSSVVKAKA